MATINHVEFVSLPDCVNAIKTLGDKLCFMIEGEPGIGKSSILKILQAEMPTHTHCYFDCGTLGEGSLSMDIPDRDTKMMETYLSRRFRLDEGKPLVIMLDEFLKTPRLLKVMFTRLILERCIGDTPLPEGSIVFGTSNNSSDGVNDTIEAHVGNRITRLRMQKPNHVQFNVWAGANGISTLTRAWVSLNTKCLNSYLEPGQDDNPFIFNPKRASQVSFVSPRSLEKADAILKSKSVLGDTLTKAALAGTVGQAAAVSMVAFVQMEKDLVPVSVILQDPVNTHVPESVGALLMTLFNAVDELQTQDELAAFMQWVNRITSHEIQGVFFTMMVQSPRTVRMALRNHELSLWAQENFELL
jgi:hypothetical protein